MGRRPKRSEAYVLPALFNTEVAARVVNFFVLNSSKDYSLSQVANACGVGRTSVYRCLPALLKMNLVHRTRHVGQAVMYELNPRNPAIENLQAFVQSLRAQAGTPRAPSGLQREGWG